MANTQPNDTLSGILSAMDFPEPPKLSSTEAPEPAPGTPQELDASLADWQKTQLTASQDWDTYFEGEGTDRMEEMRQQVMPGEDLPEPPKLVDEFQKMRGEYGLEDLEKSLNDLKAEEREQQAIRRERISGTFEERTRMSAIQGQVSEIERQEMERLDFLGREISYHVDLVNSAYKVIDMSMNYMQMDWQNAKDWWQTKFNANMSMYQQLRGEYESDRSFAQQQREWEQSVATSNLQIYVDMISNGQVFWEDIDAATKTEISKLEVKSGLGLGFLSKMQIDPEKNIKSITTRDVGGVRYADIVKVDPKTGKVTVESVKVGGVSMGGGGGGGGTSSSDKEAEALQEDREGANSDLAKVAGGDGHVSPAAWNRVRSQWLGMGYSQEQFNEFFGHYVNTDHWQDYTGYQHSTQAEENEEFGGQTGGPPYPGSNTMA
jgi:hypothetical protein